MLTLNLEDQSNLEVLAQARKHRTGILLKKVFAGGQHPNDENLLFALGQEGVHSAVVGTINNTHLRENVAVAARLG